MPALQQAALILEKGNIWVGTNAGNAVDFGAVRKVMFAPKLVSQKIPSDNRGTVVSHGRLNGEVNFDWLEPGSVSNMELLFRGLVTKSTTAGSSTPVTGEVVASGSWSYLQPIWFAQQDGAQAIPTSITVTGSTDGALTANTSYFVVQDAGTKKWGIYIKSGGSVTTLNQTITLAYTVTPSASLTLAGGTSGTQTSLYVKIVGPLETNSAKTRTIVLNSATATSDMLLQFLDVETANDVAVMPVKLESDKASAWSWTDQVNPN